MENVTTGPELDFLSGGGEMGERIRIFDWSKTPLGNPDTWENGLKTCVRIMLTSRQPMFVWWGHEFINIYNDAYINVLGDKHPAMLAEPANIVWKEVWDKVSIQVKTVFEQNEGTFDEALLLIINRYGYSEETYFKFSCNPIPGVNKTTAGLLGVCTEETQRIINERSLDTLRKLGAIIFTEKSLDIIYRNVAEALASNNKDFPFALVYKITGEENVVTVAASTGIDKSQHVFPDTIDITKPTAITKDFCEAFRENKMVVSEIKVTDITLPTGAWQTSPTQFIYLPVSPAGGTHPYCIIAAALNPYRTFDETYRQFCQLIEDRVSIEINKMLTLEIESKRAEALAEIDRAKIVFFSNISHEFRTPLTLMLSPLEEVLNKQQSNLTSEQQQHIKMAQRNALRVLKLVNTLLDFSNIERGRRQAQFTGVDIGMLTKNLAANFRAVIEKAGMKLIVNADLIKEPVYVDTQMWEKIVFNLLSNAFKYTLKGQISVELSAEENFAVLKVIDTGVGIPESELPKMFERFHRIPNIAGRTYEGTGIGLSLVKELVQMHGGEVSVGSVLHKGSVFTVKIPFGKKHVKEYLQLHALSEADEIRSDIYVAEIETLLDSQNKEAAKTALVKNDHLPTILVVDDNADMLEHISSILFNDYNVITACNGLDATLRLQEIIPALVLTDIMMPVMDGVGLLKEIKANAATASIPVIFVTARAGEESRIEGWQIGADDYLVKPFSAKELLARIKAQLKLVELRQSLQGNLRNLFLNAPAAICVLSGSRHVHALANDMYLQLLGKTDVLGKTVKEVFPELEGQGVYEILDDVYTTGKPFIGNEMLTEVDMGKSNRTQLYLNFVYQPTRNSDGEIEGIFCHGVDVTEQVQARKHIEESERQQAYLLKLSDVLNSLGAPQQVKVKAMQVLGEHLNVSRCFYAEVLEDGKHCVIDNSFSSGIGNIDGTYRLEDFGKARVDLLQRGEVILTADVATDISVTQEERDRNLEMQIHAYITVPLIKDDKLTGLLGVNQSEVRNWTALDLTIVRETSERTWAAVERAKAEEALRRSEEKYRTLLTSIDQGFTLCELIRNDEGKGIDLFILEVNSTYEKQTGVNKEMVIGKPLMQVFPSLEQWMATYAAVVDNQCPVVFENYFEDTDRWFELKVYPTEKERFAVLFSNITERKKAEEKLRESENRFRMMADASPVLIWTIDANGSSSYYNKTFLDFIGVLKSEDISNWSKIVHPDDVQSTIDTINTAIAERNSYSLECRLLRADKQWRWVLAQGNPGIGTNNEFLGFVGSSVDITERKEAETKISDSEKKFQAAIHAVQGIIWTNNAAGEMIGEQSGWANLTDQSFEEYQGYGWTDAIHPDDVQATTVAWTNAVSNHSAFEFEHRLKTKHDGWRIFSVKAVPALDNNGAVQQWVGVHTDVTEQREAEKRLAYRTALLEAHNEASVDGILLTDAKGKILSYNQRFIEIWNMPQHILNDKDDEAALSFAMSQLVKPQQFIDKVVDLYSHPTETSLDELELKNGKILERNGYPVIGKDGTYYAWSWTFKDITERKIIEQDLKNTKEQLELTFKNIPAGVYLINAKGRMVYVNERGAAVYGDITPEYMLEHNDLMSQLKIADELFERFQENGEYFSPQHSPAYLSLTTGKPSQTVLKQINRATREQRWYYVQGAPLFDEKGNVSLVLITTTDITEQKKAEEKIKESEERFRSLAQTLPQLVWITDAQGNNEFASSRWKEYSGVEPGGEKEWKEIVHPDDYAGINKAWTHSVVTGDVYKYEVRLKSKDGLYRWHAAIGEPVLDKENKIVKWVGAFTDIHEQKLRDERKDEFISIASHELKTPLTTVKGYLQMLELSLSEDMKDAMLFTRKATQSVNRLNELVGELLDVSKIRLGKLNYNITTFDFNEMVDRTIENIQITSLIHAIIKSGKVYDEVTGDRDRLQQVVINLLTNAIKYSPGAQKVFITLEQEADCVKVSVKDSGIGMSSESLKTIFDKYHRIEEHALLFQGLGIGLYISYEIIERHNGKLWAESESGKGSTFYFTLPLQPMSTSQQ